MWGHPPPCTCSLCQSVRRVHVLINTGCGLPGFDHYCVSRTRVLEGELRDELSRLGRNPDVHTSLPDPRHFLPPPPPFAWIPPVGPAEAKSKGVPPDPPPKASGSVPVKVEETAQEGGAVVDLPNTTEQDKKEKPKKKDRSRSRRRRDKESHRRRREEEDSEGEKERSNKEREGSRSSKGEKTSPRKEEGKSSSPKGDTRSPRKAKEKSESPKGEGPSPRARERRSAEKSRELPSTPRSRGEEGEREDRKRGRSQERKEWSGEQIRNRQGLQNVPGRPQGPGWRGPLPYFPPGRWEGTKNKGVVKRAKQQIFNERKRYGRGHPSHSSGWRPRGRWEHCPKPKGRQDRRLRRKQELEGFREASWGGLQEQEAWWEEDLLLRRKPRLRRSGWKI